jgi:BlaI family transcriptional regulator, penicillinase repressor
MNKKEQVQKQLTKAEEQIMQVIWKLEKAFLREIVEALPEPKPHQNTVATILKILVEKNFVGIDVVGRNHQYYALISKEDYSKGTLQQVVKGYFEGSFSNMVSFFVKEKNISIKELEQMLEQLKKKE